MAMYRQGKLIPDASLTFHCFQGETMFCVFFFFFSFELRGLWNNSALAEATPPPSLSLTRLTKLTDRLLTVAWRAGLRLTRFGKDTIPFSHSNINQHADDVRHLHVQASCAKVLLLRCRHTCDMDHTSFKSACYQNIQFFIPISFQSHLN